MSDYKLAMLVYFSLQGASLAFLPKWWKLAAVPACLVIPQIVDERSKPGYMSDVLIAMVAIYVCAYLVFVWMTGFALVVGGIGIGLMAAQHPLWYCRSCKSRF